MLSPPSSPPYNNSDNRFDIMFELESMDIAPTTADPNSGSGVDVDTQGLTLHSDAFPAFRPVSLHGITANLQSIFHNTASGWDLITRDFTPIIAQRVVSNQISLHDLVETGLRLRPTTVRLILVEVAQRHAHIGLPTPHIPESDEALAQHPFALFAIQTMQGAAFSYLWFVWNAVNNILASTDPVLSGNFIFSLVSEPRYTPNISRNLVSVNTRWHPHYGYPFWHLPEAGETRDHRTLFLEPAVHHILHQLLMNSDSGHCITTYEIRQDPNDPGQYIHSHPMLHDIVEKVAFALSWVVVQMRDRSDPSYSFDSNTTLTPDRVQSVMLEQVLISSLFYDIINNGGHNDGRYEPLFRFFRLLMMPNGQG